MAGVYHWLTTNLLPPTAYMSFVQSCFSSLWHLFCTAIWVIDTEAEFHIYFCWTSRGSCQTITSACRSLYLNGSLDRLHIDSPSCSGVTRKLVSAAFYPVVQGVIEDVKTVLVLIPSPPSCLTYLLTASLGLLIVPSRTVQPPCYPFSLSLSY